MPPGPYIPYTVQQAGARMQAELDRNPSQPLTFSPAALVTLGDKYAEHLGDMGVEAIRLARNSRLITVDPEHVRRASSRLTSDSSKVNTFANICLTFGGAAVGIGGAGLYNIAFEGGPNKHSLTEILIATSFSIVGLGFLMWGTLLLFFSHRNTV